MLFLSHSQLFSTTLKFHFRHYIEIIYDVAFQMISSEASKKFVHFRLTPPLLGLDQGGGHVVSKWVPSLEIFFFRNATWVEMSKCNLVIHTDVSFKFCILGQIGN